MQMFLLQNSVMKTTRTKQQISFGNKTKVSRLQVQ